MSINFKNKNKNKIKSIHNNILVIMTILVNLVLFDEKTLLSKQIYFDRVVAVVLDRPILHSQILQKVDYGPLVLVSDYFPNITKKNDYDRALFDAVNYQLILTASNRAGISVSNKDVDDYINKVITFQNIDLNQLKSFLKQEGITYQKYRQDLYSQILLQKFSSSIMPMRAKISDKDIKDRYFTKFNSSAEDVIYSLEQWKTSTKALDEVYNTLLKANKQNYLTANFLEKNTQIKDLVSYSSLGSIESKELSSIISNALNNLALFELSQPIKLSDQNVLIFRIVKKEMQLKTHFLKNKNSILQDLMIEAQKYELLKWIKRQHANKSIAIISKIDQ